MDSALMKTMLESQERAFKTALDVVVKQMNDQIYKLEGKISDLTSSLEFTQREVDDLKHNAKDYDKEKQDAKVKIEKLNEQIDTYNTKIKELEDRLNYQEDYSRRNNVRISGVEERGASETWEQTAAAVTSLLEEKMQLPGLVVERAHRVGMRRDDRPRHILARFARYCDRDAVMRNSNKLRGTNIFMNEDLCAASQAVKNAQMPLLKQARAQGKVAFFRHTRLIIKEKTIDDAAGRMRQSTRAAVVQGAAGAGVGEESGANAAAGGVVVEVAGAWASAGDGAFPTLPAPHRGGPPLRSSPSTPAAASAASSQSKQVKKITRSAAKK